MVGYGRVTGRRVGTYRPIRLSSVNKTDTWYVSTVGTTTVGRNPMKNHRKRVALPQFWCMVEDELDELLGSHRTSGARRDFGTYEHYDVDTEGAYWVSMLPRIPSDGDKET